MDTDRRKKILIAAGVVLLLIIIFLIWWFWPRGTSSNTPGAPINQQTQLPGGSASNTPSTTTTTPAIPEGQKIASRLARLFGERFGTYTSQGQFEGVLTLVAVSTPSLQSWIQQHYIPDLRAKYPSSSYVGQTTQVLGLVVEKSDDKDATILLHTQRTFNQGTDAPVMTNPDMRIVLVNSSVGWLVDNVTWIENKTTKP